EALKESEETFRVLAEQSPNVIFVNKKGRIVYANKKCEEIMGYKRGGFYSPDFNFLNLIAPEHTDLVKANFIKHMKGEDVAPYEYVLVTKEGKRIDVIMASKLIRYDGEKAILGVITDITERRLMEKKLEMYSQQLEELVENRTRLLKEAQDQLISSERLAAIGEVATMVGHDLRNPLQSIENARYYLNNELPRLLHSTPIPQKAMEMLKVISDSVNYADKIIKDLHDFSATKNPTLKKTDINAIVKETLSQVKATENVEFITELGHLPTIEADKDMIKRVFLNLAINGTQAMKENVGTLEVSTEKTKGFIEISFKDTGIGISKENMERLFTPFLTTKAQGMGMGLPICKKFIDAHDGNIEVESEEGKGSTFTVRLPIQQEDGGEKA
ncbi:PAS domain S-box protein, partial [Candidatus Bathyarchaeota archaeon]|nr:PAS domain S-box protein [Candidatus Bathyarchaeota archaeon]